MLSVGYKETGEALGSLGDADNKRHNENKRFQKIFESF